MASSVGIYLEPHTNNIGIGTTSPQAKQHVLGDVLVTHAGAGAALTVNQQGAGKIFEVQDAGTACVTVLDGGNVGIGTTNPLQKLHIVGNTRIQGDAIVTGNWEVQGTTTYIDTYTAVTSNVTINNVSGNGPALRVTQAGVGSNYPIADFYDNDVSTTVPALRIADGGNVGIGVTNPTSKLEIDGAIKSRNNGFYGLNGKSGKFYISMSRNLFVPSSQFEILNIPLPSTQENSEVVSFELVCNYVVNSTRTADIEHFTTITGELKLLLSISNDNGLIISRFTDYQKIIEIQGPSSSLNCFINYDPIAITNQTTNSGALQLYMIASTTYTRIQYLEIDGKITHVGTNKSLNLANITFEPSNAYAGGTTLQATRGVVDSGTQFLGAAADSVAAPSFSWAGDTNVGLYRPATDTLGVVTNGAERMRVDATGNVGIGTTVALQKLHVDGGATRLDHMIVRSFNRSLGTTVADATNICIISAGFGAYVIELAAVHSEGSSSESRLYKFAVSYNNTGFGVWHRLNPISSSGTYGVNDWAVDISVNADTTTLRLVRIAGSTSSVNFTCTLQIYQSASNQITVTDSSTTSSSVSTTAIYAQTPLTQVNGNVGIGTTTPLQKLHVEGNVQISGSFSAMNMGMFKNLLINGGFDVWQRGTNATLSSDAYSTADRWRHWTWGVASTTHSRQVIEGDASVPGAIYCLRCERTTGDTLMGTAQHLEKEVLNRVRGKTITFSAYLRKSTTLTPNIVMFVGTYSAESSGAGTTPQANSLVVLNSSLSTTSFTRWNVSLSVPLATTAQSVYVYVTTETNTVGAVGKYFDIAQAQLEIGNVATPFEFRPFAIEIQLCLRFYEKSYQYSVVPGTSTYTGSVSAYSGVRSTIYYKTHKKRVPTVTLYQAGSLNVIGETNGGQSIFALGDENGTESFTAAPTSGFAWNNDSRYHYVADAEI